MYFSVPELELNSWGTVTSIEPSPEIAAGEGNVITARFRTRQVEQMTRVTLADGNEILGTMVHPVWSADRQDWVALSGLQVGEQLQSRSGTIEIVQVENFEWRQPVYNLEIHTEHVYEIGNAGILVHNAGLDDCGGVAPGSKIDDVISETLGGRQRAGVRRIDSAHTLTENEALEAGIKFLGPDYREIGQSGSGVYRSADGTRQFRMDNSSLMGDHEPFAPHVHLETFRGGRQPFVNNHIPIIQ
ncbi:HINT domain-containing protein [Stieleria sp. TO1_6]|nr:HINT domain-containing protein [Stieleria tagensis]